MRYIPSDLETSDGKKFIIDMTDLIPLHAILGTVLSGLREHLDEQGLNLSLIHILTTIRRCKWQKVV